MAYEYEDKLRNYLIGHKNVKPKFDGFEILKSLKELQEVYRKAKAWDRMHELLIDKDIPCKDFDDEMYELLKKTGKTDIRIITDSNIDLEDKQND